MSEDRSDYKRGKHGVRHGDDWGQWSGDGGSDKWWDTTWSNSTPAAASEEFPPLPSASEKPREEEDRELREARKKKSTLWVESTGYFTKSFSELEKIIRDFFQSRDFDSYGAANFCSDPSEDHDKLIEERKGQYKSQRVLNVPASCLVKAVEDDSERIPDLSIQMQRLVQKLLNEKKIGTREGTRLVIKAPLPLTKFVAEKIPTSNDGGRRVRPLLLDRRSRRLQGKKVSIFALRCKPESEDAETDNTWGLVVPSRIDYSYQLTLCGYEFRLEAEETPWLSADLELVEKFHRDAIGDCEEPEVMLVKVKKGSENSGVTLDVESMQMKPEMSVAFRWALQALSKKVNRLIFWDLVRRWSPVEPAASPLKLHKIFDQPEDFEKEEFQADRECLEMIGRDSLTLAAAVAESAQEREKESEVDLSWEPLHRKVQDYVNTQLAASLMVSSRLMELGTRILGENKEEEAAKVLFAFVGAHKQESDMFAVVQLWEWLITDPNSREIRPKGARSLKRANEYTAGCPRYLGRTSSYMEFGEAIPPKEEDEKDPSEPHEQSELYLRVQYEEYNDAFYRWNGPQAEEKRPTTPSEKDWKPLSWDHVLGTFCSASMKLPSGELRPLPNKVCAWMRGRCMKKLVSIKRSMENTPPYSYLREEEDEDNMICLFVIYRGFGEVRYRRARNGGLGEEIYEGTRHLLSYSEHKKTLVSQVIVGWALPRKVVTWLLEYRSLGDLIPGRKKTTVDIKYDKEGNPSFGSVMGDDVKVRGRAIRAHGQSASLFEAEVDGQWKALSYSEDRKDWVYNAGLKGREEVVPWEAISVVGEKSSSELGLRLTTPTSVRKFFPNASGTAVAKIEQQTDHRFNDIKLLAESLTHCSAVGAAVQPLDHLAYVGNEVMKSFALEKVMEEASFFKSHLVFKEDVIASESFCAPKGKAQWEHWDSKPWKQSKEWGRSLKHMQMRIFACCNHVGYAVSCIKNELQRNINCSSTEMKEHIAQFEKRLGKDMKEETKWPQLFKLGAPKALGDLFLACIGAITMDSDHNEARSLMERHYKQSESIMQKLDKLSEQDVTFSVYGNISSIEVRDVRGLRQIDMEKYLKEALANKFTQELSLSPQLLRAERLPDFWRYCKDLHFLEVDEEEKWIACSSPRSMKLNYIMQKSGKSGSDSESTVTSARSEEDEKQKEEDPDGAIYCEACNMWLNGPTQWADHEIGKKHRKAVHRQQAAKQDKQEGKLAQEAQKASEDKKGAQEHEAIYCKYCEMWLNGPTQWADHEIGKKHKKAIRKGDPDEKEDRYEVAKGISPEEFIEASEVSDYLSHSQGSHQYPPGTIPRLPEYQPDAPYSIQNQVAFAPWAQPDSADMSTYPDSLSYQYGATFQ